MRTAVRINALDLPSFLWLWKIAAWSMGFTIAAYLIQVITALSFVALPTRPDWVRSLHLITGFAMAILVLVLLAIGIVGTLGHYGSLGHSNHLWAGLTVVELVFVSAWSAFQLRQHNWAKFLHIGVNLILGATMVWVSLTGWEVVQKYL